MRKRLLSVLLLSTLAGTLTSCASSVSLTDRESDLVAEYVSSIVLKYNQKETSSKLVKLEEVQVEATQTPEAGNEKTEVMPVESPSATTDTSEGQATQGNAAADMEKTTLDALYGLKDVSITYNSVKECKTYPEDSDERITATEGCKFLVVSFMLTNQSNKRAEVDMLKSSTSFRLKANKGEVISGAHTFLSNDLTYYQGTIAPKKSVKTVVLFEVKESFQLTSGTLVALSENKKACEVTIK